MLKSVETNGNTDMKLPKNYTIKILTSKNCFKVSSTFLAKYKFLIIKTLLQRDIKLSYFHNTKPNLIKKDDTNFYLNKRGLKCFIDFVVIHIIYKEISHEASKISSIKNSSKIFA